MNTVNYVAVPGCPGYRVGTDGSVWSSWTKKGAEKGKWRIGYAWRIMSPRKDKDGRLTSVIRPEKGGKIFWPVSWMVLEAFIGKRPSGMEACHNDGNPSNNSLSNLRWGTSQSNKDDREKHGRTAKGERNGRSVLSDSQAVQVAEATGSLRAVAKRFGISPRTVLAIRHGKRWVPCFNVQDQSAIQI